MLLCSCCDIVGAGLVQVGPVLVEASMVAKLRGLLLLHGVFDLNFVQNKLYVLVQYQLYEFYPT